MSDSAALDPANDPKERRRRFHQEYAAAHREKIEAYRTAWRAKNRERILAEGRDRERRRYVDAAKKKTQRKAAQERAKRWASENPERAAANRKKYAEAHPDRVRASQSAYVKRNRQAATDRSSAWRDAHPEQAAAYRKQLSESGTYRKNSAARRTDPEKRARDLASNRDRRRLMRRLARAGLPAPTAHKTSAHERRTNELTSNTFFALQGPETAAAEQQALDSPQPTAEEIRALSRELKALRQRHEVRDRLTAYLRRHTERLYREAELDSRARVARHASPLELDAEVLRRARAATTGTELPTITAPPPADSPASLDDVWVRAHIRNGMPIAGHWRSSRG